MAWRLRVLSRANGPHDAAIMLVGEAPGRLGAEQSGVPFTGDESGHRLDRLLEAAGWRREDIFITNALLCNPQDERGNNRAPKSSELSNCRHWLAEQMRFVDPTLVVTLGAVALRSLDRLEPHNLTVSDAGSEPARWFGRWLAAAYHPGARAAIHRSTEKQLADFVRLGDWSRRMRIL